MDSREIRYRHVRHLVDQCGGISQFSKRIGREQSQVGQFAGSNPTKGVGPKIAREIENAFGLAKGFIDVPLPEWISASGEPANQETEFIHLYRQLSPDQKVMIVGSMKELVRVNSLGKHTAQPKAG